MVPLRDLDLEAHLADPALKPKFVTPMFDLIAPRYDDFTRLFSFGMDRGWKDELLRLALLASPNPAVAIDLACGTGDLARELARLAPEVVVTGVDASHEMLGHGKARITGPEATRVQLVHGDIGAIPAADTSVDLVCAGYAFRNGPPLDVALQEVRRVLRPGGVLAVLDFYRPATAVWRPLFLGYLRLAGNAVGWLWHREPVAYGYIASSISAYVTVSAFSDVASRTGFEVRHAESRLGGGIGLHVFVRKG